MHCDDKRMMFVLKQEIEETWNLLKEKDFSDEKTIIELNELIKEYFEYKKTEST